VAADENEDAADPGQVPLRLQPVRSVSHLGGDPQDREGRVRADHDAVEVMGARVHAGDSGSVRFFGTVALIRVNNDRYRA